MGSYIFKGQWDNSEYPKDNAVIFGGFYYRSLKDVPLGIDISNTEYWQELPAYSFIDKKCDNGTYEDFASLNSPYLSGNAMGIYQFPNKETIVSDIPIEERHFHKMGVQMMYQFALEYYEANKDSMPNITGIYVMQGDRKKNVITQGFSVAAVEAIGFKTTIKVVDTENSSIVNRKFEQSSKLGTSNNDIAFPIISNDTKTSKFPTVQIVRGRQKKNSSTDYLTWRIEEDAMSEMLVTNKEEMSPAYSQLKDRFSDSELLRNKFVTPAMSEDSSDNNYFKNIQTNKFCVFTPDIILDKSITVNSNLFVKPVLKIRDEQNTSLDIEVSMDAENKMSALGYQGKILTNPPKNTVRRNNRNLVFGYNQPITNYYEVDKYKWSIVHAPNIKSQSIFKVDAIAVQENQIYTDYGFSSRMNSIIDVFGFDYKTGRAADESATITNFLNASRQELYDAGIMINRVRVDINDNISNQRPNIGVREINEDTTIYHKYPFGFHIDYISYFTDPSDTNNSLLQLVTNPSMRTIPYIGIVRSNVGRYNDQATVNSAIEQMGDSGKMEEYASNDYRSLHNTIVNLCKYKNEDEYFSMELARFNAINEQYKMIAFNDVTDKISKGVNPNLVPDSFINETSNRYGFAFREVKLTPGETYIMAANGRCSGDISSGKYLRVYLIGYNSSNEWIWSFAINIDSKEDTTVYGGNRDYPDQAFVIPSGAKTAYRCEVAAYYFDNTHPRDGSVHLNWVKIEKGGVFTGYTKSQDDHKYYKGDVFSQKTFMRAIRWSGLPEVRTTPGETWDWSYSWKFGQAINVYLQSFTNSYLRLVDHETIYYPYNKRFFTTDKEAIDNFVWKNESKRYLKEAWRTNDGYNVTSGLIKLYGYDELLMKSGNILPNRIYVSSTHVGGALVDQYRHIPAGQYMDYNFVGGDIMTLANFRDYLFSVQKYAIIQHFLGDRLIESDDSSSIIVGTQGLLNKQFRQLESYGTQHKESVVNGLMGVYGVDWDREKIWRIKQEYGAEGQVYFVTENLIDSTNAYDLFKFIKKNYSGDILPQEIYPLSSINAKGIVSTYDDNNKQVQFTFHLGAKNNIHEYYTLVFNEEQNAFTGFLSYDASFYMNRSGKVLSFAYGQGNSLYEHSTGLYLHMYNRMQPMILEFVVNGVAEENNTGMFEKEFHSHLINASHEMFDLVEWETEWQSSNKNPFVSSDGSMFWADPVYKEHVWTVPIMNDSSGNKGPLGSNNFSTFEPNSKMRGQWLKVRLKYIPKYETDIQFYIKNVITNFIISFT